MQCCRRLLFVAPLCLVLVGVFPAGAAPPTWSELDGTTYTFRRFLQDFGKSYPTEAEYDLRQSIFRENLETILEHNAARRRRQRRATNGRGGGVGGHVLGVNYYADHRPGELPTGYDKSMSLSRRQQQEKRTAGMATSTERRGRVLSNGEMTNEVGPVSPRLPITLDPVDALPSEVDWRRGGVTTSVKMQGHCGSCWAFASTAVLETHIALRTGTLFQLSPQELVSCAPNPLWCGGRGGCTGATAEIAFEHVRERGMVQEWNFGYQSYHGERVDCSLVAKKDERYHAAFSLRGTETETNGTGHYAEAVAGIGGYITLDANNYLEVMNVVAKLGSLTVSVACHPWHLYGGGVFSAPFNDTNATDINHLVVLEGYGTDQETGEDYWLVRNSWG